jgi:hypothetical protein
MRRERGVTPGSAENGRPFSRGRVNALFALSPERRAVWSLRFLKRRYRRGSARCGLKIPLDASQAINSLYPHVRWKDLSESMSIQGSGVPSLPATLPHHALPYLNPEIVVSLFGHLRVHVMRRSPLIVFWY